MGLTVKALEGAKPKDKPYKLADGEGLYLFISTSGGKSWRWNYTVKGKQQTKVYGLWPALSLAQARLEHRAAKQAHLAQGSESRITFRDVAKEFLENEIPTLSNAKHRIQLQNTFDDFVYPKIGDLPISDIKRLQLAETVKAIVRPGRADTRIETARRVAGRITRVFKTAVDAGYIESHPAENLARVLPAKPKVKPMASIPIEEAPALLRAIATYPEPVTRIGLQLLAYTFVRPGALRGMEVDEFEENGDVWVVPAHRMKASKDEKRLPHVVPLPQGAKILIAQLRSMSSGRFLLDSPDRPGHPISENTLLFALYRLGYRGRMTGHGFRALASTVLNQESDFRPDAIERQLAHGEIDDVRAAYNRAQYLDERRELMEWWGTWIEHATQGR